LKERKKKAEHKGNMKRKMELGKKMADLKQKENQHYFVVS